MSIRIDAYRNVLLPENFKKSPVGVKIADRPVPSVCIDLKGNIVNFEALRQLT